MVCFTILITLNLLILSDVVVNSKFIFKLSVLINLKYK